ncbi:MAG TPA: TatD family hydrolase, partial [Chthoniobacterales bacterium]|nr:TatD family hydrolase [Chthoniobacterales bacterium]
MASVSRLMRYIEPHAHMVSRVTDDYMAMVTAGCRAVCEPAFWAGFDRSSAQGFYDYFCQLTDYEPKRAARFGLPHYSWLCINSKEAENVALAEEVIALIPQFLDRPNVLGIGEIGLNKNTRNELRILEQQVALAVAHGQLILVHTPHLEDKLKGTRLIVDLLKSHAGVRPERVIIDHVEEHTVTIALDAGFWAGITLYPESKCTPPRAIDIVERYS